MVTSLDCVKNSGAILRLTMKNCGNQELVLELSELLGLSHYFSSGLFTI